MEKFLDRAEAGKLLANKLRAYTKRKNVWVVALPRGGVPVAYEIAQALSLPLDVLVVKKLGVPGYEEVAFGAIALGEIVFNREVIENFNLSKEVMDEIIFQKTKLLKENEKKYRGERAFPSLKNKTIILVDDGVATGATMKVAIHVLKKYDPEKIVVAVPISEIQTAEEIKQSVDEFICILSPALFSSVGEGYQHFPQTSDEEVRTLLRG
ncbi:MAG: phosphoribosyltransferase [Gammaproteobacteria bacterium]|nr:phosphoribosyltransferase [Gammaproteobacteria bacterium]